MTLRDFADEDAAWLVALLSRLIANLDRIAGVEASSGRAEFRKADDPDRRPAS